MMTEVYKDLPDATISTLVMRQSLSLAKWILRWNKKHCRLNLSQTFACIAMFESGTCNLDPEALSEAFAMASGNSLYVAGSLLSDPYKYTEPTEIHRVIGNVGRAGITFLISPPDPKLREADPTKWMAINHNKFDGLAEDHFERTSLHLSFTDYEVPLVTEEQNRHMIDCAVVLVETLISIYDEGVWVGEVDVLKAFKSQLQRVGCKSHGSNSACKHGPLTYLEASAKFPQIMAVSAENWDELIESPGTGVIAVRASKNWLARRAVTAFCVKKGFFPVILPDNICWSCCADLITNNHEHKSTFALIC